MKQTIQITGNLGQQPSMRYQPDGTAVTTFKVATNEKSNGNKKTAWWRVTVWGKLAEACHQYLDKGSLVQVDGSLMFDEVTGAPKLWTRTDGTIATSFEVNGRSVLFLSGPQNREGLDDNDPTSDNDDDIPF